MGTLVILLLALLWRGNVSSAGTGAFGAYVDRISILALAGYCIWVVLYLAVILYLWFRSIRKNPTGWFDLLLRVGLFAHRSVRVLVIVGIAYLWGDLWFGFFDVMLFFIGSIMFDASFAGSLHAFLHPRNEERKPAGPVEKVFRGVLEVLILF